MKVGMPLTDEQVQMILADIERLLRDPSVEISSEMGVVRIEDDRETWAHYEQVDGQRTITIKTGGGARETTERIPLIF